MNHRITSYKTLDRLAGPLAVFMARLLIPGGVKRRPVSLSRVLFIRPGGIGDAVLLIPAITTIKHAYPEVSIDVLAETRNAGVFSLCSDVDRVLRYNRPAELLSAIRGDYDAVIDTEQWHRLSAVVARLVGAPLSIGFSTNERRKLFSHPVPYSHDAYEVDSFLQLIGPLAGKTEFDPSRPFLPAPEGYRSRIEPDLRSLLNRRIVALFPGGSIAERRWGSARFHAVAEHLSNRGYGIVVIGGSEDSPAGEVIVRGVPTGVNLCGRMSLPETAAVASLSSLLISGDSGILHLGYAVGTPVVALFGPGIERKWAPRPSARVVVVNKHLACSPCTRFGYTQKCRRDAACMKEISIEEVVAAATALLTRS